MSLSYLGELQEQKGCVTSAGGSGWKATGGSGRAECAGAAREILLLWDWEGGCHLAPVQGWCPATTAR